MALRLNRASEKALLIFTSEPAKKHIQLSEALFEDSGEYVCKTARTHEEAMMLIEVGYTKVDMFNEIPLHIKPKVMWAG